MTIVVPCYNEAKRLPLAEFEQFLNTHKKAEILFVDDASKDDTLGILKKFQQNFTDRIIILTNEHNKGKAESIRKAVQYCLTNNIGDSYAYLDADLATSIEECHSYQSYLDEGKSFVFASRILKIGSVVERKFSRFISGRIIATIISNILHIKVYDTQCGCKVFTPEIAKVAFKEPFISRWLFDVELFSRIIKTYGKEEALSLMNEIPVKKWIDKGESKVKLSYFFRLWIDLYRIWKSHNR